VNAIVERRRIGPMTQEQLGELLESLGVTTGRLRTEGNSIITIRATARVRTPDGKLSDLKRTVSAVVKYMPFGSSPSQHILRWYDTSLSPNALEN
jgi:hypothetical protein